MSLPQRNLVYSGGIIILWLNLRQYITPQKRTAIRYEVSTDYNRIHGEKERINFNSLTSTGISKYNGSPLIHLFSEVLLKSDLISIIFLLNIRILTCILDLQCWVFVHWLEHHFLIIKWSDNKSHQSEISGLTSWMCINSWCGGVGQREQKEKKERNNGPKPIPILFQDISLLCPPPSNELQKSWKNAQSSLWAAISIWCYHIFFSLVLVSTPLCLLYEQWLELVTPLERWAGPPA